MESLRLSGDGWEVAPASGEGEDAWSPRQVAEHVAAAPIFFASGIAKAVSANGPIPTRASLADTAAALSATDSAQRGLNSVLGQLRDSDLDREVELGRLGKMTVTQVLEIAASHYVDHAGQLAQLRGGA
jgi:hypothetical protein